MPKSNAQEAPAAVNANKALDLRVRGLSYRRIASELGVSVSTAYGYVAGQLALIAAECAEKAGELQTIELERLDDALTRVTASDDYRNGDAKAISAMVKLSESRRKLLGLDAPVKTDVTSGGEKIVQYHFVEAKRDDSD